MSPRKLSHLWIVLAVGSLAAPAAHASFHFMQIEQVMGGVCGDATAQAIQLRMRASGQNLVSARRLIAYDAAGANPVVLITFPGNVSSSAGGSRILVTSTAFSGLLSPPTADFTLTNLIPPSYLAAGRLVFEDGFGTVYWSLSWGGAAYTGSTTGATDNDADGIFGPSYAGALPSLMEALLFPGSFSSASTNNAADYVLTSGGPTFTNNAGSSGMLVIDCPIFTDGFESGNTSMWSSTVP
jgi:hypothetical protein